VTGGRKGLKLRRTCRRYSRKSRQEQAPDKPGGDEVKKRERKNAKAERNHHIAGEQPHGEKERKTGQNSQETEGEMVCWGGKSARKQSG